MTIVYNPLWNGNDGFIDYNTPIDGILEQTRQDEAAVNPGTPEGHDPIRVQRDEIIGLPDCKLRIVVATIYDDPLILIERADTTKARCHRS